MALPKKRERILGPPYDGVANFEIARSAEKEECAKGRDITWAIIC